MRLGAVAVGIALLVAVFWVEKRAISCGAGLVDARLPYDLRADWFNGGLWLTDREGWGVVAPPGKLELRDGGVLEVTRIQRYTTEGGFLVEVIIGSGEKVIISFEGSTSTPLRPTLAESKRANGNAALEGESNWTWVDPASCLYGRFGVVRSLVAASLLVSLGAGARASKSRRVQ